ncbi:MULTISPECIES: extracellular solute-binding protein [Bacillaceae]|uniref:extracellular solute-binding protein n=1 Tax=Bacillaceae TaxID=186817 RepID=UPI000BA70E39|nr:MULTISPECIES: extracellular solute-binding protein [Bacillaceae]PAE25390.1 cyclodextrin-binding protein [Bacillus sp. 7894-2]URM32086.1 extracellular solute-binding protein [Cytobacillus firmus]
MKKSLSFFMMLVLVIGMLAACGPQREAQPEKTDKDNGTGENQAEEPKPEKLVVWEDTDKGVALKPAIESFEKEYGIKVEFKELGMADKIRDQLRLDGPAGNAPDVVTLPHDQIGQVVTEGLLQEIKVDDSVLDTFTESSISAQMYDGKLYGLPKATETPVFIYNKALMDKAPETMDELYTQAKELTTGGQYGFLALFDNFYFAHGPIAGMGGYVFNENDGALDREDVGLNNEGAVEGAEFIQKWYSEGLFPKGIIGESGGAAMDGLFNEGKAVSVMNGPWALQGMKDAGIDVGVSVMPKLPNGEHVKTFMGVKGWNVTAFTKNPYWATKLVEHITNEENAKIRFETTQEIPPVKSLIEDPVIADNEAAKAVAEQSQYAVPMPNIPEMAEVWGPMASALQTIATGKAEPKAALDDAVKTIKTNIETNHPAK